MNKRRFILKEDIEETPIPVEFPIDEVDILPVLPEEEPVIDSVQEEVPEEVAVNAYTDLLQDLLRKQWDVINSADSIIATIDTQEADINKEDVKAILNKLVEDTTVSIGMVTKALGVVDPSQEELMDQGVEKAEEVINQEPIEENLKEDLDVVDNLDFSNYPYYDRYWMEEAKYNIESLLASLDENDHDYLILESLDENQIKEICEEVSNEIGTYDSLWEEANNAICDIIRDNLSEYESNLQLTSTHLGEEKK